MRGDGNYGQIFVGDITATTRKKTGPDTITVIEAMSGINAMQTAFFDKSYAPQKEPPTPVSYKRVALDLFESFKDAGRVVIKNAIKAINSDKIPDKKAQAGLCLTGPAKNSLNIVLGALGLEWSIQDDDFQVIQPGQSTGTERVLLTPKTGLIGSPVKKKDGSIEFTALIQPDLARIRPG